MSRRVLLIMVTAICLTVAFFVWAQDISNIPERVKNAKDYEAVSNVIYREIEGWFKNDPEQVFSVFDADNFVGIWTDGTDPKEWTVYWEGRADVRAYADKAKNAFQDVPEGFYHNAEIQHVHIKGNHALAVARHWDNKPEEEKNRTVDVESHAVWILRKSGGQWKVISTIGPVASETKITEN